MAFGSITTTVMVVMRMRAADDKIRPSNARSAARASPRSVKASMRSRPGSAVCRGQAYANIRQPHRATLNLAHMCPLSAVWAGPERCEHLDGPPLLLAKTKGATPFQLSLPAGDVGHTIVVGPTGAGKSVLLSVLALQFRRYPRCPAHYVRQGAFGSRRSACAVWGVV